MCVKCDQQLRSSLNLTNFKEKIECAMFWINKTKDPETSGSGEEKKEERKD